MNNVNIFGVKELMDINPIAVERSFRFKLVTVDHLSTAKD